MGQRRDISLETLRGLAAVSVVAWHCLIVFFPNVSGPITGGRPENGVQRFIWFGLLNGTAAVSFFFVLSGYVLSRSFFLTGNTDALLRNAVKRWPRLAGPVLLATLFSWSLFHFEQYRFVEAGQITGSPVMTSFTYQAPFSASLMGALREGLFTTFLKGEAHYDSVLWTMQLEFIGSFMVFGLALLMATTTQRWIKAYILLIAALIAYFGNQIDYLSFIAGTALAAFAPRDWKPLPTPLGIAGVMTALYLFGYSRTDLGAYHIFFLLRHIPGTTVIWTAASLILLICVQRTVRLKALFAHDIGKFLGWISFPLYLVHLPILFSAGCWVLLASSVSHQPMIALAGAIVETITLSILVAVGFAKLNDKWLDLLNQLVDRLIPKIKSAADDQSTAEFQKPIYRTAAMPS